MASRHAKRLTLNVPINPPTTPSTPDQSYSFPSQPSRRTSSVTSSTQPLHHQQRQQQQHQDRGPGKGGSGDYNWLTAIASQERTVLELREELQRAERELVSLKRQWALSERARKKTEVDSHASGLRRSSESGRHGSIGGACASTIADGESPSENTTPTTASAESTPLSTIQAKMSRELERRNSIRASTVGGAALSSNGRRVFHGSHTRTLSLLVPPSAMESKARDTHEKVDESQRLNRSPRAATLPSLSAAERERHQNNKLPSRIVEYGAQQQEHQVENREQPREEQPKLQELREEERRQEQKHYEQKPEEQTPDEQKQDKQKQDKQKQDEQKLAEQKLAEQKHDEQKQDQQKQDQQNPVEQKQEVQRKRQEEEDFLANLRNSVPRDMLVRTGKQMASDLRDGLWTFLEDIKQATIGEEGADPRTKQPSSTRGRVSNGQHNSDASSHGRLTARSSTSPLRKSATTEMMRSASKSPSDRPVDLEDAFWSEFGVDAPRKSPTPSTGKAHKKATTTAAPAQKTAASANKPPTRPSAQPEMSLIDADDSWDGWDTPQPQPYPIIPVPALQTQTARTHSPSSSRSTVESKQSPTTQSSSPRTSTR